MASRPHISGEFPSLRSSALLAAQQCLLPQFNYAYAIAEQQPSLQLHRFGEIRLLHVFGSPFRSDRVTDEDDRSSKPSALGSLSVLRSKC